MTIFSVIFSKFYKIHWMKNNFNDTLEREGFSMSEVGNTIQSLIFGTGLAGPEMTHSLKVYGDGNMQKGIRKVATFFLQEGMQRGYRYGERSGIIKGSVGTVAIGTLMVGGFLIVDKVKRKKADKVHEEEGKKFLNALQQTAPESLEQSVQSENKIING